MAISVGTSGYDYPDWVGQYRFYPASLARQRHDWLTYYASRFPLLELNFTFYGRASAAQLEQMLKRVDPSHSLWLLEGQYQPRPDFSFVIKAYAELTHRIGTDWHSHAQSLMRDIAPLRESGKLLGVLAQFPSSAHYTERFAQYVLRLSRELLPTQLIAEFRHATWLRPEAYAPLSQAGIVIAGIDAPQAAQVPTILGAGAAQPPGPDAPDYWVDRRLPFSYVRLHGRNEQAWWTGDATTRYEYRYEPTQLERLAQRLIAADSDRIYVSFNNHRFAEAPRNAIQLQEILAGLLSRLQR